jgi:hypothetical protein
MRHTKSGVYFSSICCHFLLFVTLPLYYYDQANSRTNPSAATPRPTNSSASDLAAGSPSPPLHRHRERIQHKHVTRVGYRNRRRIEYPPHIIPPPRRRARFARPPGPPTPASATKPGGDRSSAAGDLTPPGAAGGTPIALPPVDPQVGWLFGCFSPLD